MSRTAAHRESDSDAAIEQLVISFFMNLDIRAFEDLADCMAPDGAWHRQGKVLNSREMILAAMAERGPDVRTAHLVSNFQVVAGDGNSAEARFYLIGYRFDGPVDESGPSPMDLPFSIGLYRCGCVKAGEHWKIAEMRGTPRFRRRPPANG